MTYLARYAFAVMAAVICVPAAQAQVTSLPISNLELTRASSGLPMVKGIMTNNSRRTTGLISVTFALYDAAGTQLGIAMANTTALEPGQSWLIQALSPYSEVVTAKVVDVKAF
ncbi:FxLYD domain-containing protein [Cupriavidus sp. MP-37]|uniref:FxLYD domain-containing protein n=1 Tax=Cupriavidus sp. MP-37 TaxID=2884455 RepID=UPI001D0B68B9|nr:FxLYD domain-containing protein [Cupriavidus sp. MP-37]UDM52017.1 FxLYD domain-containing protein [Cupriavidus sp. MP-37]